MLYLYFPFHYMDALKTWIQRQRFNKINSFTASSRIFLVNWFFISPLWMMEAKYSMITIQFGSTALIYAKVPKVSFSVSVPIQWKGKWCLFIFMKIVWPWSLPESVARDCRGLLTKEPYCKGFWALPLVVSRKECCLLRPCLPWVEGR